VARAARRRPLLGRSGAAWHVAAADGYAWWSAVVSRGCGERRACVLAGRGGGARRCARVEQATRVSIFLSSASPKSSSDARLDALGIRALRAHASRDAHSSAKAYEY